MTREELENYSASLKTIQALMRRKDAGQILERLRKRKKKPESAPAKVSAAVGETEKQETEDAIE